MHDLYEELEVSRAASAEAIRGAYKHLVQKWHPDRHPEDREIAEQKTRALNEAYGVLSDPELREEYDNWLRSQCEQFDQPDTVEETQFEDEVGVEEAPYAAPMDVRSAAIFHRMFVWMFIAFFAIGILFEDVIEKYVVVYYAMFSVPVFGMARALKKNAWVWGAFGVVPMLGWILGAILINQCSKLFPQHGLKARFFGGTRPLTADEAVKQKMGQSSSGSTIFGWTFVALGIVALASIALAIALPAYQDYKRRTLATEQKGSTPQAPTSAAVARSMDHPIGRTEAEHNRQYDEMLGQLEARYAPANPRSANFSREFIVELEARIRAYESQGAPGVEALQQATMDLAGVRLYIPPAR